MFLAVDVTTRQLNVCFLVDGAGFRRLRLTMVALHHVDATDYGALLLRQDLEDFTSTALVLASQYDNAVALADLLHLIAPLQYFWCQGDDLHVALGAKFARNRSEDTGTDRFFHVVAEDRSEVRVVVKDGVFKCRYRWSHYQ